MKLSQHFILHPIDEDLSLETPVLGYYRALPPGAIKSYRKQVHRFRSGGQIFVKGYKKLYLCKELYGAIP